MKLGMILPPIERFSPETGGAISTFAWQMGQRLRASGIEGCVFAPTSGERVYETERVRSVTFQAVERSRLGRPHRAVARVEDRVRGNDWLYGGVHLRRLKKAIWGSGFQADVWMGFNDLQLAAALSKWQLPGARVLRLSNECRTRSRNPDAVLGHWDRILHLSAYIAGWTRKRYPVVAGQETALLANGADLEHFHPREDHLSPSEPVRVLFLGRLDPNKGPDLAAKAVAALRRQGLPVELTAAGAGWFGSELSKDPESFDQRLSSLVNEAGGRMLGAVPREQIPALVRRHDVTCILSRSEEPMSQVVFEAMGSGTACLVANRGGLPEAVGEAAVIVEPDDLAQVVTELGRLVADPAWLADRKRAAVRRAAEMTWDHTAERLGRVLREAVRARRDGGPVVGSGSVAGPTPAARAGELA